MVRSQTFNGLQRASVTDIHVAVSTAIFTTSVARHIRHVTVWVSATEEGLATEDCPTSSPRN
jgi:hypothetical protein